MRNNYKANLTGVGFLLFEFKQVIKLQNELGDMKLVKKNIYEDNVFQYSKDSSLKRITPTIIRRVECICDELRDLVINDSLQSARLINLLSIIEEDDLFFAFMNEEIRDAYYKYNLLFGKKNVNIFFSDMIEKNENVAKFKDSTFNKLRQVYLKILVEAGLLTDKNNGELVRINLDMNLRDRLIANGYKYYVDILEGK